MTIGPIERVRQRFLDDQERAVDVAMLQVGTSDPVAKRVAMLAVEHFRDHQRPLTPAERYEIEKERELAKIPRLHPRP